MMKTYMINAVCGAVIAYGVGKCSVGEAAEFSHQGYSFTMSEFVQLIGEARAAGCDREAKALVNAGIRVEDVENIGDTIMEGEQWDNLNECMQRSPRGLYE